LIFTGPVGPLATGFATLPSGPGGCANLTVLNETNISTSLTLCAGTYYMNDSLGDGALPENNGTLIIDADSIELDCNGAIIIGDGQGYGIFMENRTGVTIRNCVLQGYDRAINVYNTNNSQIVDNEIDGSVVAGSVNGIYVRTSTDLNISNNSVHDTIGDGITMIGLLGGMKPNSDNTFYNNSLYDSIGGDGLDLTVNENSTIYNNLIYSNGQDGIAATSGYNHSIYNNTIYENTQYGISVAESNITIFGNNISDNTDSGIYITNSNNTIYNNTLTSNDEGIYVINTNLIEIYNNTITGGSSESVFLSNADNCNVSNNTLLNGTYGVRMDVGSNNNNIISNNASGASAIGIEVQDTGNLIYNNYISENLANVFDGAAGNNWTKENTTGTNIIGGSIIAGNYYSNYSGKDIDGDYIGDTAYVVEGQGLTDAYPLWYPTPVITATLIYPPPTATLYNITQNLPFNYTLNVSCTNANCGNINVSLDPIGGGGSFALDFIELNWLETIATRFYTNNSVGTFTFDSNVFTDDSANAIGAGDMDNDGDLDIVIGRDNAVDWTYLNNGSGTFTLNATGTLAEQTTDIAFADLNDDGTLDYVSAGYGAMNRVFINNGKGTFVLTSNTTEANPTYEIALGDFDNDGDMDLLEGNNNDTDNPGQNKIYMNDGTGTFTLFWNSTEDDDTWAVGVADLDNDGDIDFIAGNYNRSTEPGNNRVYLNNGSGSFTTGWNSTEDDETNAIGLGDFNDDGFIDFVAGNWDGPSDSPSRVYLNNGDATFYPAWNSSETDAVTEVKVGDLNDDGYLDFLIGIASNVTRAYMNSGTGMEWNVTWNSSYKNKTKSIVLGDFTGDGDAIETNCSDGLDNDLDGWIDNQDPNCKALISTTEDAYPFWTNKSSNPFTVDLDKGESQNVTFWITPTGVINGEYEFFTYANQSADSTLGGETVHINLTIRRPPTVTLLSPESGDSATGGAEQAFSCSIENSDVSTNLTFYLWDSSGNLVDSDLQQLTGPDVGASWTPTLPTPEESTENYNWNCKGYAGTSYITQYVWSTVGNYTLLVSGQTSESEEGSESSAGGGSVGTGLEGVTATTLAELEALWEEYATDLEAFWDAESTAEDAYDTAVAEDETVVVSEEAPWGYTSEGDILGQPLPTYFADDGQIEITIDAYESISIADLPPGSALPPGYELPEGYVLPIEILDSEDAEIIVTGKGQPYKKTGEEIHTITRVKTGTFLRNLKIIRYIKIGISSDYWEMIIEEGNTEDVDINKDGVDDVAITYDGMKQEMAKLTFQKILKKSTDEELAEEEEFVKPLFDSYSENELQKMIEEGEAEKEKKESKSKFSGKKLKIVISVSVLGFITIVQIIIFVNRRKKKAGGGGGAPATSI